MRERRNSARLSARLRSGAGRVSPRVAAPLVGLLLAPAGAFGQVTTTYIGPSNGLWSNPANWDIGAVPINGPVETFNAIVPAGIAVNFDIDGANELSGLSLGAGGRINISGGRAIDVLGFTGISGLIDAAGPDTAFIADSQFVSFTFNGAGRAHVRDGALVSIQAPSYTGSFGSNSDVIIVADPGSVLDLSSLSSFSLPSSASASVLTFAVSVSDGGLIDMSGVGAVEGAAGNNWARFNILPGGTLDLASLQTVTGRTQFRVSADSFTLPSLTAVSGVSIFNVAGGSELILPAAGSMSGATFEIADGGAIQAPNLAVFTNGFIDVNPARTLVLPSLTNVENSRFFVRGGQVFDRINTNTYSGNFSASTDVFLATGAGSVLDLSSLTSLSLPSSASASVLTFTATASASGRIDLSNITTLQGAAGNNWARFNLLAGGAVDLASLQTISGRTQFRVESPLLRMPSLQTVTGASLFSVSVFNRIELPALTSMSGATLEIDDGGRIEAPLLTSFTNGFIDYAPARFLVTPQFQNITNSRFFVRSGAIFDRVAATSYTGDFSTNTDFFLATDAGSLLDLSSLRSLAVPSSASASVLTFNLTASSAGRIDLSGLETIQGAGGNNWTRFNILSGGSAVIGDAAIAGRLMIRVDGVSSVIRFLGSAVFPASTDVQLNGLATMTVGGDLSFAHTNESAFRLDDGVVQMNGQGVQSLEVGGTDLGLPAGPIDPNFQIGQLVVGASDAETAVVLLDKANNGNRGPNAEPEVLYLQGVATGDGLRILGGSTLYLNGLDAYAVIAGEWTHLNALVPAGQTRVDFDGGWIDLGAPFECIADINGDGIVDADDFFLFLQLFAAGDPRADINCDGIIDADDFFTYLALFAAGC